MPFNHLEKRANAQWFDNNDTVKFSKNVRNNNTQNKWKIDQKQKKKIGMMYHTFKTQVIIQLYPTKAENSTKIQQQHPHQPY